jgi:transposase
MLSFPPILDRVQSCSQFRCRLCLNKQPKSKQHGDTDLCNHHYMEELRNKNHNQEQQSSSSSSSSSSSCSFSSPLHPSPLAATHSHLSLARRHAIMIFHELNYFTKEICSLVGCDRHTVYHWIREGKINGGEANDAPRSGRPKPTTKLDELKVEAEAVTTPITTPKAIKNVLGFHISPRTVRRILDRCGLFGRKARRTYPYDEIKLKKRLSFARGYGNWSEREWGRVIFSDEATFFLYGHGDVYCQRGINEAYKRENMIDHAPHSVKVHVWGCFSAGGIGECYIFEEYLTGKLLSKIYRDALLPSAYELIEDGEMWWLLQDNAPTHKNFFPQKFLHDNGITCIDFPPYSPDLNPIEHIWSRMKDRVQNRHPKDLEELKRAISWEWLDINEEECKHLADSMEKRCQAVIENNGERTKY